MTDPVTPHAPGPLAADKAVYDELPDGLVVLDDAGRVVVVNAAAEVLIGRSADEALGREAAELLPLVDTRGRNWWECTARARRLPRVQRLPEQRVTLVVPGRPERDLMLTGRIVSDGGAGTRTLLSLRDMRARARHERSSAELVSTVAHELRSPLTSVKGFTATLLAKWDRFTDEQKQLMLQTVNADADRVTRLLSELLDVSRLDAGRMELRKQVVDVPARVRKAFAGHVAGGEPEDRFVLEVSGEFPEMWVDPDKLDQVVGNLVENGLRHGDGTVRVAVVGTGTGVQVVVSDEGAGIPEQMLGRVFAKFWRGGDHRGGTGLGLYIVKGLVEAHGGTITAGRSPHGGAEFRFVLPAGAPSFA